MAKTPFVDAVARAVIAAENEHKMQLPRGWGMGDEHRHVQVVNDIARKKLMIPVTPDRQGHYVLRVLTSVLRSMESKNVERPTSDVAAWQVVQSMDMDAQTLSRVLCFDHFKLSEIISRVADVPLKRLDVVIGTLASRQIQDELERHSPGADTTPVAADRPTFNPTRMVSSRRR